MLNRERIEPLLKFRRRESRWRAVQNRDRTADGAFVYGVRSTGIYCRPSCPARKPRREQVVFFPTAGAAEESGFRPCRRCRPRGAISSDPRVKIVAAVCREIDARIGDSGVYTNGGGNLPVTLSQLSALLGLSRYQLERAFQSIMGITPRQYADAQRMRRLKLKLRKGNDVTTALYEAGFGSPSRLYERAPSQLGMTPAAYGRGGAGMQIHYAIANSRLGRVLVAATERGISAVYLGESDAKLVAELREEYPKANIVGDETGVRNSKSLGEWVEQILTHLDGRAPHLDLPTDVQATAFQRRVWQELRKIPYGTTRTYTEVARAIGKPASVRAVARACATNPVSIVVPCHRVVRQDGNLAGYRWGIGRKRDLLEAEIATGETRPNKL